MYGQSSIVPTAHRELASDIHVERVPICDFEGRIEFDFNMSSSA
jgi:hypothetical protein